MTRAALPLDLGRTERGNEYETLGLKRIEIDYKGKETLVPVLSDFPTKFTLDCTRGLVLSKSFANTALAIDFLSPSPPYFPFVDPINVSFSSVIIPKWAAALQSEFTKPPTPPSPLNLPSQPPASPATSSCPLGKCQLEMRWQC